MEISKADLLCWFFPFTPDQFQNPVFLMLVFFFSHSWYGSVGFVPTCFRCGRNRTIGCLVMFPLSLEQRKKRKEDFTIRHPLKTENSYRHIRYSTAHVKAGNGILCPIAFEKSPIISCVVWKWVRVLFLFFFGKNRKLAGGYFCNRCLLEFVKPNVFIEAAPFSSRFHVACSCQSWLMVNMPNPIQACFEGGWED